MTITPTPPRSTSFLPALAGAALVLVLVAGIAVAGYFGLQLLQRDTAIPTMVDANTHAFLTFTPNLRDIPNIERLSEAFPEVLAEDGEEELEISPLDDYLTNTLGVSFDEDIEPWIGTEIGVAITFDEGFFDTLSALSSQSTPPSLTQTDEIGEFYLIMQSRDDAQLNAFIEKISAKAEADGTPLEISEYKGMQIYEFEADRTRNAFAVIKNHLVVTNTPDGLPLMLDREEANSLAATPSFQRVRENMPESAIAYAYYNQDFYRLFSDAFINSSLASPNMSAFQMMQESVEAIEGFGLAVMVEENGVRFESVSAMNYERLSEETRQQYEESQTAVGRELPLLVGDDALFMSNARLPASYGEQLMEGLEANPETADALEMLESDMGINLQEDLFSWFVGDLVGVVLPGEDEFLPVSGYIRVRSANPAAAKPGIENLVGALVAGGGESPFVPEMIDGVEWMVLPDPSGSDGSFAGYAFIEDDVIIAVGAPAIEETGERGNALLDSATYQAATQGLPESNTGVFYVNLQEAFAMVDEMSPGMLDSETQQRLAPFVAIAGAREAGLPDDGILRGELFIYIVAPETE
jgi:hypothetical protein